MPTGLSGHSVTTAIDEHHRERDHDIAQLERRAVDQVLDAGRFGERDRALRRCRADHHGEFAARKALRHTARKQPDERPRRGRHRPGNQE